MTGIELGQTIRERRISLSLTQENLADYTDMSVVTVSLIERGKANPSFETMNELLSFLGLELIVKPKAR